MRDLNNLYVRANTCVACHQNVDADLLRAGHPELIFELDGQSVTEPKHWREETNWSGAQTWLVGQAVALREMSWQLARENPATENALTRHAALYWLILNAGEIIHTLPVPATSEVFTSKIAQARSEQKWADDFARAASAAEPMSIVETRKLLDGLATDTAPIFRDATQPQALQARRAERLVLALDRLVARLDDARRLPNASTRHWTNCSRTRNHCPISTRPNSPVIWRSFRKRWLRLESIALWTAPAERSGDGVFERTGGVESTIPTASFQPFARPSAVGAP